MSSGKALDGYDARLIKDFLGENWQQFLTFLEVQGEGDPEGAAKDIDTGLEELIEREA